MNFLSESSIDRFLQQAHSIKGIENNHLIPSWLQPSATISAKPILYCYEFVILEKQDYLAIPPNPPLIRGVGAESTIKLSPDDTQLPSYWETDSIAGIYEIVVEGNTYPGVSQAWLDAIWLKVKLRSCTKKS